MSVRQKKEQILRLLESAYERHEQWNQAREKAVSQLLSMSNLAEQLETLRRCERDGRLGSLSAYPQIVPLTEGRIMTSFERALGYLHKESECLAEVCKRLKSLWKEAERLLIDIAALQGLENVSSRSSETFSLCDVAEWLKQLNTAHLCDLTEKQAALGEVVFSPGGVERVRRVWEKQPRGLSEVLDCVRYTVEQGKKR